jgi:hypothetical protein
VWEEIVKPLTTPLVGWGRGRHDKAREGEAERGFFFENLGDVMREIDEEDELLKKYPIGPNEQWLRTSQAYNAFTNVILSRLQHADPGNGHGIARYTKPARPRGN